MNEWDSLRGECIQIEEEAFARFWGVSVEEFRRVAAGDTEGK